MLSNDPIFTIMFIIWVIVSQMWIALRLQTNILNKGNEDIKEWYDLFLPYVLYLIIKKSFKL
jgi:hypothetical protein